MRGKPCSAEVVRASTQSMRSIGKGVMKPRDLQWGVGVGVEVWVCVVGSGVAGARREELIVTVGQQ